MWGLLHEVIFLLNAGFLQFCEKMACLFVMVQLLLLLRMNVTRAVAVNQDSITALTSFMSQKHAMSSVIFGCWKKAGKIQYWIFETNTSACPSSRLWLLSFSTSQYITALKWIQFTTFNPVSLKSNLMISSHLYLLFQVVPFLQVFKPKSFWGNVGYVPKVQKYNVMFPQYL
jgi:hypothetical protein